MAVAYYPVVYNADSINKWKQELAILYEQNSDSYWEQPRYSWLKQHIELAGDFLDCLKQQPERLFHRLSLAIHAVFSDYEEEYFHGLSPQVRVSLHLQHHGLDDLQCFNLPEFDRLRAAQINYLRLCGFLQYLYRRVEQERLDEVFLDRLRRLLELTHVAMEGDLPDSIHTGSSAIAWYRASPYSLLIEAYALPEIESSAFFTALKQLKTGYFHTAPDLKSSLMNAVKGIEWEIQQKIQQQQAIDYFFYTRILRQLQKIAFNPMDFDAARRLAKMTEHAAGNGSLSKKVLGGLSLVIGMLIVSAGLAGLVSTWGAGSLLFSVSILLGVSLIQSQAAVSLGCSVAAVVGAGLTFWGSHTIDEGKRNGLSLALKVVADEVLDVSCVNSSAHA